MTLVDSAYVKKWRVRDAAWQWCSRIVDDDAPIGIGTFIDEQFYAYLDDLETVEEKWHGLKAAYAMGGFKAMVEMLPNIRGQVDFGQIVRR